MAKGGKKKAAKKTAKKKADTRLVTQAVGGLMEAVELLVRGQAQLKTAIGVLNDELELGLDTVTLSAMEADSYTTPPAPLKKGSVPTPANGSTFTPEELANPGLFTRPVLASILTSLGGDPTSKMVPALRMAILEAQGGRQDMGDCDFTGDEGVPIQTGEVDGETYSYGPRVLKLMEGADAEGRAEVLRQLVDGEIEV